MVKRLLLLGLAAFALGAQAQYQVLNSDFESWGDNANEPGGGWFSFPSARVDDLSGLAKSFAIPQSKPNTTKVTGRGEKGNAVHLISRDISFAGMGGKANGNLTTGRINMGSTTPSNSKNYNFTDRTGSNKCAFTGHPDAFEYWAKFKRGENGDYNARCHVILHGDCDYKDPYETDANIAAYKIAEATVYATPCDNWTKFSGEFEYASPTDPGKNTYVLASFTTNPTAGGSAGDEFDIDDIRFVYWHALSALSYNEEGAMINFSETNTNYDLSSFEYDATKLSYTVKGRAATVATPSVNSETGVVTIRVEGEDYGTNSSIGQDPKSFTEYTIQFKPTASVKTYSEDLYVTVDGLTEDKEVANVLVTSHNDGTINFNLKNFVLNGMIPVGNIAVENISVASDNSFAFNGGIQIAAGDDPAYNEEDWAGPFITGLCNGAVPIDLKGKFIDEDNLLVTIDIDLTSVEGLNQMVYVHLGYDAAPMMVNAEAQYGTFCAPFAVEIPSGVQVYTVPSVSSTGELTLSKVTGTIPANTPVVLFAENGYYTGEDDAPLPIYVFGLAESGTPTVDLLTGVYAETPAPVGSYVLQNLDNKVAFYQVSAEDPITVPANRCYLTAPAGSVKALAFPDGTLTSISEIQAADEKAVIYDLSGRRVSKATKGIYIINGKKVIK